MNDVGFPILSLLTWLPLVGCMVIMSVRGDEATVASNAKWAALTKASSDTALRDIDDLVKRGILVKDEGGGRSTSYSLARLD